MWSKPTGVIETCVFVYGSPVSIQWTESKSVKVLLPNLVYRNFTEVKGVRNQKLVLTSRQLKVTSRSTYDWVLVGGGRVCVCGVRGCGEMEPTWVSTKSRVFD